MKVFAFFPFHNKIDYFPFIPFLVIFFFLLSNTYEKPNLMLGFRPSSNKVQYKVSHVGTEATVWEDRRLPTPVPRSDL